MPNVISRVAAPIAAPTQIRSEGAVPAHARSEGTINPALRIFKVPPTDISINAYRMVTIQPTTTGINPMEFIIPALDDYVDLGRSYFTMELRLKRVRTMTWWPMKNVARQQFGAFHHQANCLTAEWDVDQSPIRHVLFITRPT